MTGNSDGNRKSFDKNNFSQQSDVLNIVLDHITQGMVVVGPDYRTLAFNRHFEDIFQLPPGTVEVGVDFRDILRIWAKGTGQDQQMLDRAIYQLDEAVSFEFEFAQLIKGERRWCRLTHNPLPQKGCVRTFTDITGSKQTEVALRESESRYRSITETSRDIIFRFDPEGRVTYVSPAVQQTMGYKVSEIVGKYFLEFVHPDDHTAALASYQKVMRGEDVQSLDLRGMKSGGDFIYAELNIVPLVRDNIVFEIQGVIHDITERKNAEDVLKENETRFKAFVEQSPVAIGVFSLDGKGVYANHKFLETLGMQSIEDMVGRPASEYFSPRFREESKERTRRRLQGLPVPAEYESTFLRADGTEFPVHVAVTPIQLSEETVSIAFLTDITERKLAENVLKESEHRYRNLFEYSNDAIFIHDDQGHMLDVNQRAVDLLGYSREELLVLPTKDYHPAEVVEDTNAAFKELVRIGHVRFDSKFRKKNGLVIDVEISVRHIDRSKAIYQAIVHDITERKRAEKALQESENRFRVLLDQVPSVAVQGYGMDGTTQYWNHASETIYGYTAKEAIGQNLLDLIIPPEMQTGVKQAMHQMAETGHPIPSAELTLMRKDGSRVTVYSSHAIVKKAGDKTELFCLDVDLSERKLAEDKLFNMMREQKIILDNANVSIWKMIDRKPVWVNQKTVELFQYQIEELIGQSSRKLYPSQEAYEQLGRDAYPVLAQGGTYVTEQKLIRSDGAEIWVRYNGKAIEPPDMSKGVIWILEDVTDRKQIEENIRQSEQFIRNILDTVDEGFIVIDPDYRIQTANKAYCRQVGGCDEEIIGRHCYEVSHKTTLPCYEEGEECAARKVFETGKFHSALHRHTDAKGNILFVETKAFPIKDAAGKITSVIESINNITERYLLEEERLKTQKLESIGTLAGGIAHDFNNLLQGVFGYISLAKITAKNPEKSAAALEQAEKALHQSVNLTTQLLTFAKGGKPAKKLIDLRLAIENTAKFTLSGSRAELRLDLPEDLWQAEADGGQLGQVLQNIVLNADQSMPVGGMINVTADNMATGAASLPPGLAQGNYVKIAIQDTGVGIPEQYLTKIFDPYFTTKEKGSGLGLATSYSIVKNHGGMIDVRTKSGEGSTFIVYIPAIVGQVPVKVAETQQMPSQSSMAKVLVMDDEDFIRDMSNALLGELGHEVVVVKHGQEAIKQYQGAIALGRPFDIVILDLTIRGGMGGVETVQELLKIDPHVKAVVSSGYSDDAATADYLSQGFKASLKKPYDVDALRSVISIMLKG